MRILILGLNYAPEKVGIAVYTTGMAEALVARGHKVKVVAGQPYYPAWKVPKGFPQFWFSQSTENGVHVTRVPHYVPANPSGAKRLIHHVSFALTSLLPTIFQANSLRPDVILTVAPSLIGASVAKLAAKLTGAKSWLHIQDFEVEAAFATGLISKEGLPGRWARRFESFVLRGFNRISTISPQMRQKLIDKGIPEHEIFEFRNWSDVDAIGPLTQPSEYIAEWNISTPHVALYSGNIANKQGIEIVVEAAKLLAHRSDLTFVICGEGPNRTALQQQAIGTKNIQFHDLQPKERLNELVGLATIHLLPQLASTADLLLPSKLTNMLASGRPIVVTSSIGTGLASEIDGCGLATPPGDATAFAKSISDLLDNPELRETMSINARARAVDRWSYRSILTGLEVELLSLIDRSNPRPSQSTTFTP